MALGQSGKHAEEGPVKRGCCRAGKKKQADSPPDRSAICSCTYLLSDIYFHPDFSSRDLWYRDLKLSSYSIEAQVGFPYTPGVQTWTGAQHRPPYTSPLRCSRLPETGH